MYNKHFNIKIDKNHYKVTEDSMTGIQIKQLANIPNEYELWLEVPGQNEDKKIEDNEVIDIKSGLKFFSSPSYINPGGC
jgi:hypothetical protein